jgi:hypothetical protein
MRAENLFPDGLDSVEVNGVSVRKGSIAAFIYNALTLDRLDAGAEGYDQAAEAIRELTPALQAVRVFDVFALRSERVAQIVESAPAALTPGSGGTSARPGSTSSSPRRARPSG